jgi:OmpA-OmpF porin, OOP family
MESGTKILIGATATALLAWGSHGMFGHGARFVDGLESQAKATLSAQGADGVTVSMEREPALKRVVILSGDKSDAEKAKLIAAMEAIPGVADARWDDGGAKVAATPAAAEVPATKEAVAACQGDINTLMTGKTINFQSGSAYLAAESTAIIDELAKALQPCAGTSVEVQGHTDLTGSSEVNQTLSQARAEAVAKALTDKGVPAERLTAKGFGSSQPVENARTAAANATNRRTVFSVAAAGAAPEGGQ